MSQSNEDNLCDTYTNVEEVRQLIDIKIDYLKQLLDERRIQLNHELDEIEQEVVSSDEKSRMLIQKLINHKDTTITLFGEIDSSSHVSSIKSKISSLEQELDRQKVYFKWRGGNIAANMESLGSVGFESNDIYKNVDNLFKDEQISYPKETEEKEQKFPEVFPQAGLVEEIDNEKYMYTRVVCPTEAPHRDNKSSPNSKKPALYRAQTVDADDINKPKSLYENTSDLLGFEHHRGFSEQATSGNELSDIVYESFEIPTTKEEQVTGLTSANSYDGNLCEFPEITYETVEEYTNLESVKGSNISFPLSIENCPQSEETMHKEWKLRSEKIGEEMYQINQFAISAKVCDQTPHSSDVRTEQDYEMIEESTLVDPGELITRKPLLRVLGDTTTKEKGKTLSLGKTPRKWVYDLPIISVCNQGTGMGELNRPKGVYISDNGNIFVAEKGNNRVQVFSKDGNHLYMFGQRNKMVEPNNIWTSSQFVYVTLPNINTIQMYTVQGGFLKQRAKEGKEEGRLKLPCGISGDTLRERLYVCDTGNNRIQIFDYNLHFIQVMRTTVPLDKPLDIQITNNRNLIIVLDRSPRCIHMFKGSGELIKEIIDTHTFPKLVNPLYLTTQDGSILLSDYSSNCVHVFSDKGELIWRIGDSGKGKPFDEPRGLACDKDGRLVTVCNRKEDQLQIFEI